jgi:hypothetical protein
MALEREIETYRCELPDLLAHKGKYVVIHGDEVAGVFDGFEDALTVGYARFGGNPFLVRKISETEKVLYSSRSGGAGDTPDREGGNMGRLVVQLKPGERVRVLVPGREPIWVGLHPAEPVPVRLGFEGPEDVAFTREALLGPAQKRGESEC